MTWEIACGFFAIISAFISVMTAAAKVNRAIVMLEAAVERLNLHTEEQRIINKSLEARISRLERGEKS